MSEIKPDLQKPSFQELVEYLKVLGEGYVKPDLNATERIASGVVRDTKKYFPYIEAVNTEMCERAGISFGNGIERNEVRN